MKDLESLTRKQLQSHAKKAGIKANLKTVDLIAKLREYYQSENQNDPQVNEIVEKQQEVPEEEASPMEVDTPPENKEAAAKSPKKTVNVTAEEEEKLRENIMAEVRQRVAASKAAMKEKEKNATPSKKRRASASKQATPSRTPSKETPKKKAKKTAKTPNFNKLHEKMFNKMKDIGQTSYYEKLIAKQKTAKALAKVATEKVETVPSTQASTPLRSKQVNEVKEAVVERRSSPRVANQTAVTPAKKGILKKVGIAPATAQKKGVVVSEDNNMVFCIGSTPPSSKKTAPKKIKKVIHGARRKLTPKKQEPIMKITPATPTTPRGRAASSVAKPMTPSSFANLGSAKARRVKSKLSIVEEASKATSSASGPAQRKKIPSRTPTKESVASNSFNFSANSATNPQHADGTRLETLFTDNPQKSPVKSRMRTPQKSPAKPALTFNIGTAPPKEEEVVAKKPRRASVNNKRKSPARGTPRTQARKAALKNIFEKVVPSDEEVESKSTKDVVVADAPKKSNKRTRAKMEEKSTATKKKSQKGAKSTAKPKPKSKAAPKTKKFRTVPARSTTAPKKTDGKKWEEMRAADITKSVVHVKHRGVTTKGKELLLAGSTFVFKAHAPNAPIKKAFDLASSLKKEPSWKMKKGPIQDKENVATRVRGRKIEREEKGTIKQGVRQVRYLKKRNAKRSEAVMQKRMQRV